MKELLDEIVKTEHGFKHIINAGQIILNDQHLNILQTAEDFIDNSQPYQVRMLGTYLLGELSISDKKALFILETKVSGDENWRVQEMLAKAFDTFCQKKGYEAALPTIESWINHENTNIQRAVTEGLRIWTGREFFREHPDIAIQLIAKNINTESEYLRKSIGNALRDIRKKHPEKVMQEISKWDINNKKIQFIIKLINK